MNYMTWKKAAIKIVMTHLKMFAYISHAGSELKLPFDLLTKY